MMHSKTGLSASLPSVSSQEGTPRALTSSTTPETVLSKDPSTSESFSDFLETSTEPLVTPEFFRPKEKMVYLIGSLRNPRIPELATRLRDEHPDVEVFDDWVAAGPEADDHWKAYETGRSRTYSEALAGYAARHVFEFDKFHLDRASHALLVLPAGKSGHMELMYAAYGVGAETAILLDPEDCRWDVMYQFIPHVLYTDEDASHWLESTK
jgi:hypothetical protein